MISARAVSGWWLLGIAVWVACPQPERVTSLAPAFPNVMNPEEEVFGDVFHNGVRTTSTAYRVVLRPFDALTASRLRPPQLDTIWADPIPGGNHMYGWYDPRGGGSCGELAPYLAGNLSVRAAEAHRPGPGQQPPPGAVEAHCIRPCVYELRLFGAGTFKAFRVDYLQSAAVSGATRLITNATAGTVEAVEATSYDDLHTFSDYVLPVDLTPAGFSDSAVLDVENAATDAYKATFTNQTNPTGSETDYFRFSGARSTSSWGLLGQRGRALSRLHWDLGILNSPSTNYYDGHADQTIIRLHRFQEHVSSSRTVRVALELMRPDEQPDDTIGVAVRQVVVNRLTPFACDTLQAVVVWQSTDQYLSAGCSTTGANIRYRWRFSSGGAWTPYTADTLHDFSGHASAGSQPIWLEVKNLTTGLSSEHPRLITVQSGQITLSGPTVIQDKGTKNYSSNMSAQWFERYNPALVPWFPATAYPQSSMTRIWPAGDYTVELRQQDSTASLVRRGRLHITVCHDDPEPCGPLLRADDVVSGEPSNNLFGGGPWVSWSTTSGPQAVRFYDLWGMHDEPSPFTNKSWLDSADVSKTTESLQVSTSRSTQASSDGVTRYEFAISRLVGNQPYVFGIALDPDLGSNPADDQAGFDAPRHMAYVQDGDRAIGFLLRSSTDNALSSTQQVGVGRWAPTSAGQAWQLQRQSGVRLIAGPRDVQLVLSTVATTGPLAVTLFVVRGRSLAELQSAVDATVGAPGEPH